MPDVNLADKILNQYLRQTPERGDAWMNDPMFHAQVSWTRDTLGQVEKAMEAEGISGETALRVLNRVMFSRPEGPPRGAGVRQDFDKTQAVAFAVRAGHTDEMAHRLLEAVCGAGVLGQRRQYGAILAQLMRNDAEKEQG